MRLTVLTFDEVPGQALGPFRFDAGGGTRPEPRGLHDLGRHHEPWWFRREMRSGEDHELRAASAQELLGVSLADADLAEQTGQDGLMNRCRRWRFMVGCGHRRRNRPPEVLGDPDELRVQVSPFADSQAVQILSTAPLPELVRRQLRAELVQVGPQIQQGQELRPRCGEARMRGIGCLAMLGRPLAYVRNRQCGRQHEHRADHALFVGLDQHARQPRIDRYTSERPSDRGESAYGVVGRGWFERPEFVQ